MRCLIEAPGGEVVQHLKRQRTVIALSIGISTNGSRPRGLCFDAVIGWW
jgi:hypothetical protein